MASDIRVEYDQDAECPMTEWDGMWTLYSFNRNSIHYKHPEEFFTENGKLKPGIRRKMEVSLAWFVDYYEHGLGAYSISGEGMQCQWDTARCAGIVVWENKPGDMGAKTKDDRKKDCRDFLEMYNNWMNGQVYGNIVEDEERVYPL